MGRWRQGQRFRAVKRRQEAKSTGVYARRDRTTSGHRGVLIVGATGPKGGISRLPGLLLSYSIRQALRPRDLQRSPSVCRVYDGAGHLTALIDPQTRTWVAVGPPPSGKGPHAQARRGDDRL